MACRSCHHQGLKPHSFHGSARLKPCPDTNQIITSCSRKCRNSRRRHECRRGTHECVRHICRSGNVKLFLRRSLLLLKVGHGLGGPAKISLFMLDQSIQELEARSLARIASASTLEELEAVRVDSLGRKGPLAQAGKEMGKLPPEDRARIGKLLNRARQNLEQALEAKNWKPCVSIRSAAKGRSP